MSSGIQFDPAAIRALAQILKDTDLTEIELVEKDSRIRVARQLPPAPMAWAAPPTMAAAPAPVAAVAAAVVAAPVEDAAHPGLVASPMVGVAYLSPEPGQPNFVSVGGRVEQGATVLLIEAMKTFNQIKAPRSGTVTRILVESGQPVEYGAPLLIIE